MMISHLKIATHNSSRKFVCKLGIHARVHARWFSFIGLDLLDSRRFSSPLQFLILLREITHLDASMKFTALRYLLHAKYSRGEYL